MTILLAACNLPQAEPTGDSVATNAAQTVAAELTLQPGGGQSPSQTVEPGQGTEGPEATETAAPPTATAEPTGCTDEATFVSDVNVPDDTNFEPGEDFTKTWRLRNSGTCSWTTDYDLIFDSGRAMAGPASQPLEGNVPPNSTVDISVDLTAPNTEGTHRGNWMLRNADGVSFGIGANSDTAFWVQIVVGPTPTPAPVVYNTDKGDLEPDEYVDLDDGDFTPSNSDRDLLYDSVSNSENYLDPVNGALIDLWGGDAPSYEECQGADLDSADISFDDISVGDWICFETNEGRLGRFEIEGMSGGPPPDLTIDIRTWE
jgi:hypothetical protein